MKKILRIIISEKVLFLFLFKSLNRGTKLDIFRKFVPERCIIHRKRVQEEFSVALRVSSIVVMKDRLEREGEGRI